MCLLFLIVSVAVSHISAAVAFKNSDDDDDDDDDMIMAMTMMIDGADSERLVCCFVL